jgi:hypothetical protein
LILSRSVRLKIRNVADKSFRENRKHISCPVNIYLFIYVFENSTVYEIMWKNIVERDRQATDDNMAAQTHCMLDN